MKIIPPKVGERALARVAMGPNGCHISTYHAGRIGYALIGYRVEGKVQRFLAHRAAWTAIHGQIPDDLTIDHVCRTRRCVNVDHLRLLSRGNNARRNHGRDYPLEESCSGGHAERRDNGRGALHCPECEVERLRRWRQANPERYREQETRRRLANPEALRERKRQEYLRRKARHQVQT